MQYKLLASAAFAATAFAQADSLSSDAAELLSVVSVLETALPSSLIQEALTNSAAVSSQLASEFAAGETPAWFTALPSDVKTYLIPGTAQPTDTATLLSSGPYSNATSSTSSDLRTQSITTSATLASSSDSSQSGGESTTGTSGSSSSSEGGASMPTAVLGMGLAGAVGLIGVLAL